VKFFKRLWFIGPGRASDSSKILLGQGLQDENGSKLKFLSIYFGPTLALVNFKECISRWKTK